jgi:SAM-dependent methyltransferase
MTMPASPRAQHEIEHGRRLASGDTEATWGWATPAGQRRAARRAALIAQGAQLGKSTRIIEIGCGTGLFTEMFAASGAKVLAVDISPELLDQAKRRSLPSDRVRFLERRVEECRLDDPEVGGWIGGPVDAVIGSSVLHHLDLDAALTAIHGLLAPGGWLSFAEPNMLNPQVFAERTMRPLFPYVSADETAFVRWPFASLLRRAGFDAVEIVPFDWLHPATPPRLIGMVDACGRLVERLPLLREFAGSLYIRARRSGDRRHP